MPPTGRDDNVSEPARGPSRRSLLVALGAGTLGASGPVLGRSRANGENDGRDTGPAARIGAGGGAGRPLATGTWPRFQYDRRNTGHAPTGAGPRESAGARWGYRDGDAFDAVPVVTEDTVYAADAGSGVVAVDRSDGTERWRAEADVGDARLTYADGTLFVPANELEARSPVDGSVEWSVGLGGPESVAVSGKYAYVTARSGVYRVNRGTQAVDWQTDRINQPRPGLALTDGYVYVAGKQYGEVLAVDPATGKRRWLRRVDGGAHGAPTVDGKRVVVPGDGELVGLAYESGVPKWTYAASVRSSVAVADGVVFATDEGEDVFALDLENGEEQWRRAVVPGSNPPAVVGGLLYVAGTDGTVAAVSPSDGSVVWRETVGGPRDAGLAVAGGELYAGDREGQLVALASGASGGLETATPSPSPTPASGVDDATPTATATGATPTSGAAPGFGALTGVVATGVGALVGRRLLSDRDEET